VSLTSVPILNRCGGKLHNVGSLTDVMFENIQRRLGQPQFGTWR